MCSTTEAVQSATLPLESIYHVHSSHSLAASMLGIGHSVANNVLKEDLEHSTSLLIDQTGDTLHTTTTSQTSDSRLSDALDVVTKHFPVALGTALSKTLAAFATSRHG